MKKLNLKKTWFAGATELTREQLKKVMGGDPTDEDEDSGGSSPKIEACKSLNAGSRCSYEWNNTVQSGCCTSYMASQIFCSTLDTSCW